jgi:hypothetical protein
MSRQYYLDEYNLPVQADGDRGDTASRVGIIGTAIALYEDWKDLPDQIKNQFNFFNAVSDLNIGTLEKPSFVRHFDGSTPYKNGTMPQVYVNNPNRFSRDQHRPLVVALSYYSAKQDLLKNVIKEHIKRFGMYQNADIASPECVAVYLRAMNYSYITYPLLVLGDLFTLGNILIRAYEYKKNNDNVGDIINLTVTVLQSITRKETFLSKFNRYLLNKFIPVQKAWDHYFREDSGANPLNELYKPIISKHIERG